MKINFLGESQNNIETNRDKDPLYRASALRIDDLFHYRLRPLIQRPIPCNFCPPGECPNRFKRREAIVNQQTVHHIAALSTTISPPSPANEETPDLLCHEAPIRMAADLNWPIVPPPPKRPEEPIEDEAASIQAAKIIASFKHRN